MSFWFLRNFLLKNQLCFHMKADESDQMTILHPRISFFVIHSWNVLSLFFSPGGWQGGGWPAWRCQRRGASAGQSQELGEVAEAALLSESSDEMLLSQVDHRQHAASGQRWAERPPRAAGVHSSAGIDRPNTVTFCRRLTCWPGVRIPGELLFQIVACH